MTFGHKSPPRRQHHAPKFPKSISPSELSATPGSVQDPSHPFYQKTIVFTGELSIDRRLAMQMAIDAGATVRTGVSSKTDYLVVGSQDVRIVGSDGMSGKEEKAAELNASGKGHITVLNETQYHAILNGEEEALANG